MTWNFILIQPVIDTSFRRLSYGCRTLCKYIMVGSIIQYNVGVFRKAGNAIVAAGRQTFCRCEKNSVIVEVGELRHLTVAPRELGGRSQDDEENEEPSGA